MNNEEKTRDESKRRPTRAGSRLLLLFLAILTLASAFILPLLGRTIYPPSVLIHSVVEVRQETINPSLSGPVLIFWSERLPKTLLAMLAGSGLALAGLALQALFRNPLASPFTLGIASGAAFGAILWIQVSAWAVGMGLGGLFLGFPPVTWSAFFGAILATVVVLLLSRSRDLSSQRILLAGIAVSFFFSSLTLAIQYISDPGRSFRMIRWTMGGIDQIETARLWPIVVIVFAAGFLLFFFARELDILTTGQERAMALGVDVVRFRFFLFALSSVLVGVIVSACGPIGFVGLMVPHFCRLLVGTRHRTLVPATALVGAFFLGACFTLARTILHPDILPVGILTSLLGGPFFLWLLLRSDV